MSSILCFPSLVPRLAAVGALSLAIGLVSPARAEGFLFDAPFVAVPGVSGNGRFLDLNGDGHLDCVHGTGVLIGKGDGTFSELLRNEGGSPFGFAIGDLDGDGKIDIVTTDFGEYQHPGSTIGVGLGNGDGTFGSRHEFPAGEWPYAAAIGDLNGDGKPDVVVTNRGWGGEDPPGTTLSVFLGNGDGTLQPRTDYGTGDAPQSLAIADFNGDGRPDLVTGNFGAATAGNTVSVLLGNGDGTFASKVDYTTGIRPSALVVADLNGDGRSDLALATTGTVTVLLGNGDGSFGAKTEYPLPIGGADIVVGDLNRDGKLDLVTEFALLLGDGTGGFGAPSRPFQTDGFAVEIADLNEDGNTDVVSGRILSFANGDGTFGKPPLTYKAPPNWDVIGTMATGDFNGDGKPDLALPSLDDQGGFVSVLLGDGDGRFTPAVGRTDRLGYLISIAAADLDGDGSLDLVAAGQDDLGGIFAGVWVLLGNGDGTFRFVSRYETGGEGYLSVAIGDLNGDGNPDLAVSNEVPSQLSVLAGNGDGTFGDTKSIRTNRQTRSVAIGDLNGDSHQDLVTANWGFAVYEGSVSVLLGAGDLTFSAEAIYPAAYYPESVSLADLDGDGDLDVVAPASGVVSVFMGDGSGTLGPRSTYPAYVPQNPGVLRDRLGAVADLNNDGTLDIGVVGSPGPGGGSVLLGKGDGTFALDVSYGAPASHAMVITDLNQDGRSDVVMIGSVLLNKGSFPPNTPPDCAHATAVPSEIFARGHRLVPVRIEGVTDGDGDPVEIEVMRVTQDEPLATGRGEGECADARLEGNGGVALRAERSGVGNGRVYTIWFAASDSRGGTSESSVRVCVPHDQGGAACVDDGQRFNALGPSPQRGERAGFVPARLTMAAHQIPGDLHVLEYALPAASDVTIAIYDITGRRVAVLEHGPRSAGVHELRWSTKGVGAGVYFYDLRASGTRLTKSILVVK